MVLLNMTMEYTMLNKFVTQYITCVYFIYANKSLQHHTDPVRSRRYRNFIINYKTICNIWFIMNGKGSDVRRIIWNVIVSQQLFPTVQTFWKEKTCL